MQPRTSARTSKQTPDQDRRGRMYFDYKNTEVLKEYINPHARMHSRRRTGFTGSEQRSFANAIKRARFMALMPFITR